MSEVKRWKLKGFLPGVEGECKAAFQPTVVMAEDFDNATRLFLDAAERCLAAERREKALQQRLTAADERADLLYGLLRSARQYHGVTLFTDPPQDAWKHHRMNERIDEALNSTTGAAATCTWKYRAFSWHTGCGKEWQFTDGGLPVENGMRFCHSCGKNLVVADEGEGDE